jgi:hypothetical protein
VDIPGRARITEHPVGHNGRKGRAIPTIGCLMVFLGLVNPLFWASIIRGMNAEIILMNAIFSGLIILFGVTLILIGRSRITRDLRDDSGQESYSHDRRP